MLRFTYRLKITERVKAKCSATPATTQRKMAALESAGLLMLLFALRPVSGPHRAGRSPARIHT